MLGNIYIVGAPRSGKSTLARLVCREYPRLNQVSFEAVRNGFMKAQPKLDMGNRNSEARKKILPGFVSEFLNWNRQFTGRSVLMEGSFAQVRDLMEYVNWNDLAICLGFGGRSLDEVASEVLEVQGGDEYSAEWSVEQFKKHFYDLADNDLDNMVFCRKYGLRYYDVFERREEVCGRIMNLVGNWMGDAG